jgi:chromosome partitioning protein
MNIVAIASQKGGAGKSTFAVNLATLADTPQAPALLIDTDAQGSLSVWHDLRGEKTPLLVSARAGEIPEILDVARAHRIVEWVFIDAPPQNNSEIAAMMRAATLVVIPTRPALFDLASVNATVNMARSLRRPFFVALNAVPPKRGITESPVVLAARKAIRDMGAPVWRGAIAQRSAYTQALALGRSVVESEPAGPAAQEMQLLWRDVNETIRAMAALKEAG